MSILLVLFPHASFAEKPRSAPTAVPATAPAEPLTWLSSLDEAYKDAVRRQRPILVVYEAEWCAPCRQLQKEMQRPEVRATLAHWTLVHRDVDKTEPGANPYAGPIPALRILSASAKPIASREGYMTGEELTRWLVESVPKAADVDPNLAAANAPDAAAAQRLVAKLTEGDAAAREAVIHRLGPWPQPAAVAVADAFARGNLRTRLAALELLQGWKAPVQGVDPWKPETIDIPRLEAIRKWAAATAARPTTAPDTRAVVPDAERLRSATREIDALLHASGPAEASLLADRLARMGPALMPSVTSRLKDATTDRDRERLTALRYRLVATQALMLGWPGGIDRLASADPQVRHDAAEELSQRVTPDDGPLLLELFSDPDPLVRELSLVGLQAVGGKDGVAALTRLLHDPVANVRAAVLKQLAQTPSPEAVDAVVAYTATEKDPDLVVHAVRVFRAAKGAAATKCLIGLLEHESWRVRAEAIDALMDMGHNPGDGFNIDAVADAVLKRLDDPDGFVAGRALAAMKPLGRGASLETMSEIAKRRPELALEVVKLLASERGNEPSTRRTLQAFCSSANPAVRAVAVPAYALAAPKNCEKEVKAALSDSASEVRIAGCEALFAVFGQEFPRNGMVEKPSFFGFGGGMRKVDPAEWLEGFRSGKSRAAWYGECLELLRKMIKGDQAAEQIAAAYPLVAMGHDDEAMPILDRAARSEYNQRVAACRALPWLPWEKRLAWFNTLWSLGRDVRYLSELAGEISKLPDPRAADTLWNILADKEGAAALEPVYSALRSLYGVEQIGSPDPSDTGAKPVKDAAHARLQNGTDAQRVIALALMAGIDAADATSEASKLYQAAQTSDALRVDAFQVMLLVQQSADAQRSAADGLVATSKPEVQRMALTFLAVGGEPLQRLHESIWLPYSDRESFPSSENPVVIKAPAGLKAEVLQPFIKSQDREEAAYAGYLLCVLGDHTGLAPVLAYWNDQKDERWDKSKALVYRAITALDDDAQTPVLEQIYKSFDKNDYEIRRFYWTIRPMHGPQVLKLRKTIRDKFGMDKLR